MPVHCQCILFLHAFLGCDTTSSIFGIGKGLSIKAFNKSEQFQQCASIFCHESLSKEQVCEAGEKALITMYNGKEEVALDEVRYNIFDERKFCLWEGEIFVCSFPSLSWAKRSC